MIRDGVLCPQGLRDDRGTATISWNLKFDDPIRLPNGHMLVTLRDAGEYITGLSARKQKLPQWQAATRWQAAEGRGSTMFAEIAMRKALAQKS